MLGPEKNFLGGAKVRLISGKDLAAKDINGKSDPFVLLGATYRATEKLDPKKDGVSKSRTIKANLNPEWNQDLEVRFGFNKFIKLEVSASLFSHSPLPLS